LETKLFGGIIFTVIGTNKIKAPSLGKALWLPYINVSLPSGCKRFVDDLCLISSIEVDGGVDAEIMKRNEMKNQRGSWEKNHLLNVRLGVGADF